ncbi:MAG: HAMP domain-containing protein [Lachnospiraceae bacterium]|nr:HAMP domain-containing protein [Lachnospiraceae bacterium]
MKRKLFITYFIIAFATMIVIGGTFFGRGYSSLVKQSEEGYMAQAQLLGTILEGDFPGEENLEEFVKKYATEYNVRITVVTENGDVVAESSAGYNEMENHASRIEVKKALAGEKYSVKRYSKTLGMECMYCAVPVETEGFNGVIRIGVPLKELKSMEFGFLKSTLLTVIVVSIAIILVAVYFSNYLTRPLDELTEAARKIAKGNLQVKIYTRQGDQIGLLADAFNSMAEKLKYNMAVLYARNNELEAILYSMNNGVAAIDEDNKIIFCNQEFKTLVERDEDDITGLPIYHIMRNQMLYDVIDKVKETENFVSKEGNIYREEECIMKVSGTPLYEEKVNKTVGVLLIFEDVTQIRKLEHMRSEFVSNVSHEFKTPLTSIRGFVDTLKNGAIHDEKFALKFLDIIDIETERLYNLIQDILLLSEIENNNDYNVKENDVKEIVGDVITLLNSKVKKNVELIYEPDAYIRPYTCNADRMKQLMINLVDNAIKYTEGGNITVKCSSDGNFLYLSVQDTGKGIEKESLERIFERFYRVDKSRSSKTGGTGLGLSIVKHIVEMYNGDIEVESEVFVGTKFLVKLPYQTVS